MESGRILLRAFVRQHSSGGNLSDTDGLPYDMWMDQVFLEHLITVLDSARDLNVEWESVTSSDVQDISQRLSAASGLDIDTVSKIVDDVVFVFSIPDVDAYPGIYVEDLGERSFVHSASVDSEVVTIPYLVHVGDWLACVTTISDYGFEGCTRLKHIDVPEGLDTIEACAFKGCTSLESIDIPSTVTDIRPYAFKGCKALLSINVHPDNPKYRSVNGVVFRKDDDSLYICPEGIDGDYHVPDGMKSIANSGFEGCSGVTSISIPASVSSIVSYAFDGCTRLSSICVDDDNRTFSSSGGVLFSKDGSKLIRCPQGLSGSYVVPNDVVCIEYAAFAGCSSLESITVPDGVTTLGLHAFEGCTGLRHVVLPKGTRYAFAPGVAVEYLQDAD